MAHQARGKAEALEALLDDHAEFRRESLGVGRPAHHRPDLVAFEEAPGVFQIVVELRELRDHRLRDGRPRVKAKEFRFVGETVQKGFEPEKVVFPERPQGERPVARAPDFFHAACRRHSEVRRAFVALDGRFAQVHRGREREGTPRGLHDRVEYDAAQGRNGFGEIGEALEHARQRNACFGVLQSSLREKRHGVASRSGHERRAEVGLCAVDDAARSRLEDRA